MCPYCRSELYDAAAGHDNGYLLQTEAELTDAMYNILLPRFMPERHEGFPEWIVRIDPLVDFGDGPGMDEVAQYWEAWVEQALDSMRSSGVGLGAV
jgi:hypothetical protein